MSVAKRGQIEIGICSDMPGTALAGLRGFAAIRQPFDHRTELRRYQSDVRSMFEHLREMLAADDPAARIAFIETGPPEHGAEAFAEVAAACGMPLKQFTRVVTVGGDAANPDALVALRGFLDLARRAGTVDRINLQVAGDSVTPPIADLVDFHVAAEEMSQEAGVTLLTETHVDRYTHDPRRLLAVHAALLERTGGRLGLRVAADLSHYVHQIGNPHFPQWSAISSGALKLDPFDPDNDVSRHIIAGGLVWGGHLRAARPNDRPPGRGSIQYPIVDPRTDPATADMPNGGMGEPWDSGQLAPWREWYRQLFRYQLQHPERPVARFSAEFIGNGQSGDYRLEPYRNVFQNVAMVAIAQRLIREIQADLAR